MVVVMVVVREELGLGSFPQLSSGCYVRAVKEHKLSGRLEVGCVTVDGCAGRREVLEFEVRCGTRRSPERTHRERRSGSANQRWCGAGMQLSLSDPRTGALDASTKVLAGRL